jgi:acetylornithine deacetylase
VLTAAERAVVDAVDLDAILADLSALVAIPSVDGTEGEHDAQAWCAARLSDLGLEVDHWLIDVAALAADHEFPGMEVPRTHAWGCVGVMPSVEPGAGDDRPALVLNGHVDVVPPGPREAWRGQDPFAVRRSAGTLWGRGTCDMKAGVAAVLGAVAAVRASGTRLRKPLAVHTVIGEEDGGLGTYATLRRGHGGAACVIAEPTAGTVIPANAGALTFRIVITGSATHGSTRTRGVSAIDKLEVISRALRELELERNARVDPLFAHLDLAWPLSIGIVRAGDWASTVPDRLVAEGRFGVIAGEPLDVARAAFEAAIAVAAGADPWLADHPVAVSWPGGAFASGSLPNGHRLLDDVRGAVADLAGSTPAVLGAPYGSDLRQYAAAGVPCVQYGPGDVRFAHATDEHVEVADVLRCARAYALLAVRLCG